MLFLLSGLLPTFFLPSRLIQLNFPRISQILNGGMCMLVANQNVYLRQESLWPFFLEQALSLSPSDKQPLYPPSSPTLKPPSFPNVDTASLL